MSQSGPCGGVRRFGGFVLDLDRAELRYAGGAVVPLRPKTLALLDHLVSQAGRVAEREAILDAVWPGVTVGDDSLSQAVAELRRALGPEGARLIRTVPRRGYLLDAEVSVDPLPRPGPLPPANARPPIGGLPEAGAALSAPAPPTAQWRPRFKLLSRGARTWPPWAASFGVLAASAVWWLGAAPPPAPLAGEAAQRVAVPAAPVPSGATAPADSAPERPSARMVAEALHQDGIRVARDVSACRPRWLEARPLFERAIAADPLFAPAHAEASYTYTKGVSVEASLNPTEDLRAAERSAREAITFAPDLLDGHAALGDALRWQRRHEEALAAYRRAVSADGQAVRARGNMGLVLLALGRAEEAGDPIRASLATAAPDTDQTGNWLHALGLVELHLERGDRGAENFRRSLAHPAVAPYDVRRLHFAAALALGGRREEARAVAADVRAREPELGVAWFRARAASDHPAYLKGREALYRGLALAGVPEEGGRAAPSRLASPSCIPAPPPHPPSHPPPGTLSVAAPPPAPRQEAWRLFQEGERAFWGPMGCPANWLAARNSYEAAIAADPSFAPAYGHATFTHTNMLRQGLSANPAEDLRTAERLAERAVALAPDFSTAHGALGSVLDSKGRLEEALAAYRRGVALDGSRNTFRSMTGFLLLRLGRAEEAEAPLLASIALDPQNWFRGAWQVWLGEVDLMLGRGDFGARHFRASLSGAGMFTPDARRLHLAAALALGGRVEDARAIVADVLAREPRYAVTVFRSYARSSYGPVFTAQRENLYRGLTLAGLPEASDAPASLARVTCS